MASVNLPLEIICTICDHLDCQTLKSARLVSRSFAEAAAPELFRAVYLGLFLESLAKLENVARHPRLSRLVRKLILCGESLSILSEQRYHAAQGGDPPDYRRVLPEGVPLDRPVLEPWRPLNEERFDTSIPSAQQRRSVPIHMIGPSKGKPAVLLESTFTEHLAFYDFSGRRIRVDEWKGLGSDYVLPRGTQEQRLYQHHQYFYEQANWLTIGSNRTCAALALLQNLRQVVISPTSVRYFQSEPFWHNMSPKLCELPSPFRTGSDDLVMTAPIILPLLCSLAGHNAVTSLEVLMPVHLGLSEIELAPLFKNLSVLSVGVGYNTVQAIHGVGFSQYQQFAQQLVSLLKHCARLRSLNLWFPKQAEDARQRDGLEEFTEVHLPRLAALTLTGFTTTSKTLTKLLQTHSSTLRALDLKSLRLVESEGWQPLIASLPALLPHLDWFWADALFRGRMTHQPDDGGLLDLKVQVRHGFDLPLYKSIQYFVRRTSRSSAQSPPSSTSADPSVFDTTMWYQYHKEAMVDMLNELLPLLEANHAEPVNLTFDPGSTLVRPTAVAFPREEDLRVAEDKYQQDLQDAMNQYHGQRSYRRHYDAVRRRVYGYQFE